MVAKKKSFDFKGFSAKEDALDAQISSEKDPKKRAALQAERSRVISLLKRMSGHGV